MVIQVTQVTRCVYWAATGQESTSDTSVIRDTPCLVPQSEDACPAANGAEIPCSVRFWYKTKHFSPRWWKKSYFPFGVKWLMCCLRFDNWEGDYSLQPRFINLFASFSVRWDARLLSQLNKSIHIECIGQQNTDTRGSLRETVVWNTSRRRVFPKLYLSYEHSMKSTVCIYDIYTTRHICVLGIGLGLACNGGSCGEYH